MPSTRPLCPHCCRADGVKALVSYDVGKADAAASLTVDRKIRWLLGSASCWVLPPAPRGLGAAFLPLSPWSSRVWPGLGWSSPAAWHPEGTHLPTAVGAPLPCRHRCHRRPAPSAIALRSLAAMRIRAWPLSAVATSRWPRRTISVPTLPLPHSLLHLPLFTWCSPPCPLCRCTLHSTTSSPSDIALGSPAVHSASHCLSPIFSPLSPPARPPAAATTCH